MDVLEKLNWRYAVKKYTNAKIPQDKLNRILEAIRLSASSIGLQPYSVLVIENQELRKKLLPAGNNQPQIIEASQLIVFAAWETVTEEKISAYIKDIAEVRGVTIESLEGFKGMMAGLPGRDAEQNFNWAARQTYIALGTGLVAAAIEGVDATPMEGFNAPAFDEILNLKEKGLRSVSIMALGYRDAERDPFAKLKKVRRSKENLFIHF
ncbi:MAG: NAD(P)H-dependent oxidoreductase [Bacteroidetes bacterium]|nr:NAD(P)H-dependent oxidoreductase [Bacteroidota bacterium]